MFFLRGIKASLARDGEGHVPNQAFFAAAGTPFPILGAEILEATLPATSGSFAPPLMCDVGNGGLWHIASIRGDAALWSLSKQSGH